MIADLHCHYPMHLLADDASPSDTYDRIVRVRRRPRWLDRLRALVVRIAARGFNYRDHASGWRVTFDGLERSHTRLVFSVLFEPFAEVDLDELPQSAPEEGYFADLIDHLDRVEEELERIDPPRARHLVVRSAADLEAAQSTGRMAFVHCVEGGFHLGGTPDSITANVAELARRGAGYVTLAHLFYRRIATNAPALPMLSDAMYNRIFCQPRGVGLTPLGEAAVRAMYEHRVLVDVSHMRADALRDTFALLDRLDGETGADPKDFPVIASHAGYRFGKQAYMLDPATIKKIARRDGVVGLILARHQLQDGRADGEGIGHTVATICAHVDKIREVTGSHDHVGIGSDLDGFIKPTMSGVESAEDLAKLEEALRAKYPIDADAILSGNALRVVTRVLAQRPGPQATVGA
jgi:microsomal dipeptidase-like Zn-dependent dipeptidase